MSKARIARAAALCLLAGSPAAAVSLDLTLWAAGLGLLTRSPATITLSREAPAARPSFVRLRAEPGDSLASLASLYRLSPRDIKLASGITRDQLALGQPLRVPLLVETWVREPRLPPGVRVHVVRTGEVLSTIRAAYDVTQLELVSANPGIRSLDQMAAGTRLLIPGGQNGLVWRLKPGQSLTSVSRDFGVPVVTVARANRVSDPTTLRTGDYILLPGVAANATMAALEKRRAEEQAAIAQARALEEARRLVRLEAQRREAARLAAIEQARLAEVRRVAGERRAAEAARAEERRIAQARADRASSQRVERVATSYRPSGDRAGYGWPLRSYRLTSSYGRRSLWVAGSNFHAGLDLAAPTGTPIYAAQAGTVLESGWGGWGINVIASIGGGVTNVYGHMSRTAVSAGQTVDRGQLIGFVGCTGACTGPHVHFEVQVNGAPRNPMSYLP